MGTPDLPEGCPSDKSATPPPPSPGQSRLGRCGGNPGRACSVTHSTHQAARAGRQPAPTWAGWGPATPHRWGTRGCLGEGQPRQAQHHSGNQRPSHCPEAPGLGSWCPAGMPVSGGTPSQGPVYTMSAGTRRNPSRPTHWVSPSPAASPAKANREMLPTGGPGDKGDASALEPAALHPIQEDLKPERD